MKHLATKVREAKAIKTRIDNPILPCVMCGKELPVGRTTRYKYCSECLSIWKVTFEKERRNRLKANDPKFDKRRDVKKYFGISLEEYEEMIEEQGGSCAICGTNEPRGRGWHVDHDHGSGVIRGVLCHHCNLGIGHFKDDTNVIKNAISYLEHWKKING